MQEAEIKIPSRHRRMERTIELDPRQAGSDGKVSAFRLTQDDRPSNGVSKHIMPAQDLTKHTI